MQNLFTADLHMGHFNIISYTNRPFKTLEEMNETIIRKWNERVKDDDTIICVGDFCFRNSPGGKVGEGEIHRADYYMKRLKGHKIFIRGNHDNNNSTKTKIKSMVIGIGGREVFVVHNPEEYNPNYEVNLVGHIHGEWKTKRIGKSLLINVGVDVNNFYPLTWGEIEKIIVKERG